MRLLLTLKNQNKQFMKRILSLIFISMTLSLPLSLRTEAEEYPALEPMSCTSIMVGRKASADGAVITSHTCDGNYRTWVGIVPAVTYDRDTTVNVFRNRLHTESVKGAYGMTLKGAVFQPAEPLSVLLTRPIPVSTRSSLPWARLPLPAVRSW